MGPAPVSAADGFLSLDQARAAVLAALRESERPLLCGHVGLDGDALGSAMALWRGLRGLGKEPQVAANEPVPMVFRFLLPEEGGTPVVLDGEARAAELLRRSDLLVVLDNNAWSRLGYLEGPAREQDVPLVCVDHHVAEHPFAPVHWVDTSAAATGLLVEEILDGLHISLDAAMATALYTSLVNDTGWFRHSNTDVRALEAAARFVAAGARPPEIDRAINYQETLPRKRLLSDFLRTLEILGDGRLALGHVTRTMLEESGCTGEDTESLVDHVRTLQGVWLAGFLREEPEGIIKLSLRAAPGCSARRVARALGGGGHEPAAGATVSGSLDELRARLLSEMEAELRRSDEPPR